MRLLTSFKYRYDNFRGRLELLREDSTVRRFNVLYYFKKPSTWASTNFLGVSVWKYPTDLWSYQEIIFDTRPDVLIETGTAAGGSAYYFARLFDLIGAGRVVTVDLEHKYELPEHPRITYLTGSSVAPETIERVREHIRPGERVMVVLDSDHSASHVLEELRAYGPLVSRGCYMVAEDSNVNGNPSFWGHGPGPAEAVRAFLKSDSTFEVDRSRERFMLTTNPGGYLRRVT